MTEVYTEPEFILETVCLYTIQLVSGAQIELVVHEGDKIEIKPDGGPENAGALVLYKTETPGPFGPIKDMSVVHLAHVAAYQERETVQRKKNPKFNKPGQTAPTAILGSAPTGETGTVSL